MERKIGEIFEYNGEWYQCVKGDICADCAFVKKHCNENPLFEAIGSCSKFYRKDASSVVFKKLEKVGKPYNVGKKVFQLYNVFIKPYIFNAEFFTINTLDDSYISIEIKQTKEDMKENEAQGFSYGKEYDKEKKKHPDMLPYNELKEEVKEYDRATVKAVLQAQKELSADVNKPNLKPFSLEAAKAGKPVCTRDGRKARIICFDQKDIAPIVGLVTGLDGKESIYAFYKDGRVSSQKERVDDLMMLPEKKEGWINIYNADTTFYYVDGRVFETKDEAVQEAKEEVEKEQREKNEYIDTIRVEWEE